MVTPSQILGTSGSIEISPVDIPDNQPRSPTIEQQDQSAETKMVNKPTTSNIGMQVSLMKAAQPGIISDKCNELSSLGVEFAICAHLLNDKLSEKEANDIFNANILPYEKFESDPTLLFNPNGMFRIGSKLYPTLLGSAMLMSILLYGRHLNPVNISKLTTIKDFASTPNKPVSTSWWQWIWPKGSQTPTPNLPASTLTAGSVLSTSTSTTPVPPPAPAPSLTSSAELSLSQSLPIPNKQQQPQKLYTKSLKPSSSQLSQMNLKPGMNPVTFSITAGTQTRTVSASIFLVSHNSKFVISDIDGTITKSDMMGHVFAVMGQDGWCQPGVAELFTSIGKNGYWIIYLTSRPIGQAGYTRDWLSSISQGTTGQGVAAMMPLGPIFTSPLRLLSAIDKELIKRKPQEFKMECLQDILQLFPENSHPFHAGFGNKFSDVLSYKSVGIPEGKIFTINPRGQLRTLNHTFKKTYSDINQIVDFIFPPLEIDFRFHPSPDCISSAALNTGTKKPEAEGTTGSNNTETTTATTTTPMQPSQPPPPQEAEQFNDFNYWGTPIPKLDNNKP
ncbi:phosphatidate phosphatase [Pelomyxa schiedti]|nr:phosphatidate phosphatase [Pelomyxa schiedti]